MKIVYMGTPNFAVCALQKLVEDGHEIGYVVTQIDKAKDRGKKIQETPVKQKAKELGIEVLQPESIRKNIEFIDKIKAYVPDLIVVAAYGQILPKEILDIPVKGCINIHASLLPRHRGAAPIQRAILEGDENTGVTLMYMEEGLDTGDMIAKSEIPIDRKTGGSLDDELAILGAELLARELQNIQTGNITREKQDDTKSTYAPMIFKKDGEINFTKSAQEIERLIRAFDPWPGTYTYYKGETMKIWQADVIDEAVDADDFEKRQEKNNYVPGTIAEVSNAGIRIITGQGQLLVKEIQMPGKKRIKINEFLRGNNIEKFTVLG